MSSDDLEKLVPRLRGLRERFLSEQQQGDSRRGRSPRPPRGLPDYWSSTADLEAYDAVLAARIGWKWDAVFRELRSRGFDVTGESVLDFGCGTGIATRRYLAHVTTQPHIAHLHDRSPLALQFAEQQVRRADPTISVEATSRLDPVLAPDVLLISHVLGELTRAGERDLVGLASRSRLILWVEPGSHPVSRRLGSIRDRLLDSFTVVAPCTHDQSCCALRKAESGDEDRDWCHFFAPPPAEVFSSSQWVRIGRQLGIDLRSLPYSHLVLRKTTGETTTADSSSADARDARVIGRPTIRSKFARMFVCDAAGLHQATVFKSDSPELYRQFKKPPTPLTLRRTSDKGW